MMWRSGKGDVLHGGRRTDFVVSIATVVDSIVADVIVVRRRTSSFRCDTEGLEKDLDRKEHAWIIQCVHVSLQLS